MFASDRPATEWCSESAVSGNMPPALLAFEDVLLQTTASELSGCP